MSNFIALLNYFTVLSDTIHSKRHLSDNIDASGENATPTFSHNNRWEAVTGHPRDT